MSETCDDGGTVNVTTCKKNIHISIIGDAFVDIFCRCSNLPVLGGDTLLQKPMELLPGGSGVNTATHLVGLLNSHNDNCDAASLVSFDEVNVYTAVGMDDHGDLLRGHANEIGFKLFDCSSNEQELSETSSLVATGHCLVIVADDDRSFLTYRGCIDNFQCDRLSQVVLPTNSNSSMSKVHQHFHIAGYYNITSFWNGKLKERIKSLKSAREALNISTTVSLVPQYDASGEWDGGILDILECVDLLIMSENEALSITKCKNIDDASCTLQSVSPGTLVIITRSSKGAIAVANGKQVCSQRAAQIEVVDPTGAGDAFAAGFLYGFLKNGNFLLSDEAVRTGLEFGCAVGTANVLVDGASKPSKESKIKEFLSLQSIGNDETDDELKPCERSNSSLMSRK